MALGGSTCPLLRILDMKKKEFILPLVADSEAAGSRLPGQEENNRTPISTCGFSLYFIILGSEIEIRAGMVSLL